MVPVIELDMRNPARAEPTTPFTGFPPWTRGDDDEYEDGERHQAKRRLERLKARSWRGRNGKPSALATRALPAAAEHSNHRRGILKDAIDAVDKIVFGDSSEEAATSDESGYDSDSSTAPNGPLRDTDYPLTLSPPPLVTLAPAPQPITPTLTASPEVVLPTEESLVRLIDIPNLRWASLWLTWSSPHQLAMQPPNRPDSRLLHTLPQFLSFPRPQLHPGQHRLPRAHLLQ